jgi:hypothetical protein
LGAVVGVAGFGGLGVEGEGEGGEDETGGGGFEHCLASFSSVIHRIAGRRLLEGDGGESPHGIFNTAGGFGVVTCDPGPD